MPIFDRTIVFDAPSDVVWEAIQAGMPPADEIVRSNERLIFRVDQRMHLFQVKARLKGTTVVRYWIRLDSATALDPLLKASALDQFLPTDVSEWEQSQAEKWIQQLCADLKAESLRTSLSSAGRAEVTSQPSTFRSGLPLDAMDLNLMSVLKFSLEDLAANRQGRFSLRQIVRLKDQRWAFPKTVPSFVLLGILVVLASFSSKSGSPSYLFVLIGLLTIGLGPFVVISRWLNINAEIATGEVAEVTGAVQTLQSRGRGGRYYYIDVDQQRFQINKKAFEMIHAPYYRLYYAPQSMIVLTLERVEAED